MQRKIYPPGTFLPFPQRLGAILQLCIAFSLLLWYLFQPFMGEYFELRSRLLIYEYAMGTNELIAHRTEQAAALKEHKTRFAQLPKKEKEWILSDYRHIQHYAQRPAWQKVKDGLWTVLFEIPPFEMAWIVFSITIAILLLLQIEGSRQAVWLIPLIAAAYIADNQLSSPPFYQSADLVLFPSEESLISQFIEKPIALNPLFQKAQLEKGWANYLAQSWSQTGDALEGEFNFTIARLGKLHNEPISKWARLHNQRVGLLSALLFLCWSLCFAWISFLPTERMRRKYPCMQN
jgi:hypothetical protein